MSVVLALLAVPPAQAEAVAPPSPPQNVQVTSVPDGFKISWDAPAFDGGSAVTYRVYRGDSLVADGLATTSYVDDPGFTTAAATTYYVSAVNDAGESARTGGGCILLEYPYVAAGTCIELVLGLAFWAVDTIIRTVENPPL